MRLTKGNLVAAAQTSAESDEWYSPAELVRAARFVLGGEIDLDPASDAYGQRTIRATEMMNRRTDGLEHPWHAARVFVNPPGARQNGAARWWAKAVAEHRAHRAGSVFFVAFSLNLLQTSQNTTNVHPLSWPICIPDRRIAYKKPGQKLFQPPHPSALILISRSSRAVSRFYDMFGTWGYCNRPNPLLTRVD